MAVRRQRALRGFSASTVATTIAAAAHTFGGGDAPAWWLVLGVVLLSAPAAVWLVGRRLSVRGIAAAVGVSQGLLHVTFAAVGSAAPRGGLGHHSMHVAAADLAAGGHLHLDAGMLVAHVAAAALTTVLLCHGERLLRALARGMRRLLAPVTARPLALAAVPATPTPRRERAVRPAFLSVQPRRGPPAFAR
jgi:hypothetical protein